QSIAMLADCFQLVIPALSTSSSFRVGGDRTMRSVQLGYGKSPVVFACVAVLTALIVGVSTYASAATICVNSGGTKGCQSSIQAAIDSVTAAGSTIVIQPGTYTAACGAAACSVASILSSAPNASKLIGLSLKCRAGDS